MVKQTLKAVNKSGNQFANSFHGEAASTGKLESPPFTVGFAAETNDVIAYAKDKLKRKGLNMLVANDVSNPGIGFNSGDNEINIVDRVGPNGVMTKVLQL